MKYEIYCRSEFVGTADDEEKVNILIFKYIYLKQSFFSQVHVELKDISKKINNLRGKEFDETIFEYFNDIKNNNPEIIEKLNEIGMAYYKEKFKDVYIYRNSSFMSGFILKNYETISLDNLLLECNLMVPEESDFIIYPYE